FTTDRRFGYYRRHRPEMRSCLGVAIVAGGEVLAELYLAEKVGAREFTGDDERVVGMLAGHAALAVATAQRTERARELSVAEERNRLARGLHDSVTQTLFSLALAAESAIALHGARAVPAGGPGPRGGAAGTAGGTAPAGGTAGDLAGGGAGGTAAGGGTAGDLAGGTAGGTAPAADRVAEQLERVRLLAGTALAELRSLVETLRPPDVDAEGLTAALRKRVELLRRVHDTPIELTVRGARRPGRTVEREGLRVANEAVANALQHAGASRVTVTLELVDRLVRLAVADDGMGFDPAEVRRTSGRFGLTSMRERAEALGGLLRVDTAPGAGTTVRLEVPGDC